MKRCSHEGVCQVLDHLFLADDLRPRLCVIVVQLIPGMSLRTYLHSLPDRKMPERDVVTMASQLLEVLEHIHSQGVIHQDISPANILTSKERDWRYKVCDFGTSVVSRDVHDVAKTPQTNTSGLESATGTPHYMSPEAAQSGQKVDARTDIWSLGVILFEALTGTRPFGHDEKDALEVIVSIRISSSVPRVKELDSDISTAMDERARGEL